MLKHIYRFLGLVIVFVAALFFFGKNIEVIQIKEVNEKTEMEGETLPIVSVDSIGMETNRMYGYVNTIPANNVRESITVLSAEKTFSVYIDECETIVNKLNYEVRAVSDNTMLDYGEVSAFDEDAGRKRAKVTLETEFEASKEYALKLTLVTDVSKKINYYSRVKYYADYCYVKEKIEFAKQIHKMTMDKDQNIVTYIEPVPETDNSSFAHVDITSSFENIVWGDNNPKIITDIVPTIKEINIETGAIVLDYYATMKTETGEETYYVNEYYRVKHTDDRMYLLWFERSVEACFDPSLASVNKSELKLGIVDNDDMQPVSNDAVNKIGFVRNGNVYLYDLENNELFSVYEQYINGDRLEHELYRQQNTHIISVDEEGNMCFAVYGYIAHGVYEGKVAIILYQYHKSDNAIEELLYIPFQTTYQILKENFEEYSYLNGSDVFYFAIDDKIYSYNLVSAKLTCLADNIGQRNFMIIKESNSYVWESNQSEGLATEITVMDLKNEQKYVIEAGNKKFIRLIGVMGDNIVYGIGNKKDITYTTEGRPVYAMSTIEIINRNNEVIKSYSKKGVYITDASVSENVVYLNRARKEGKKYKKIVDDNILNRLVEIKPNAEITERVTEKMLTEKYMSFPGSFVMEKVPDIKKAEMFVTREEKALYLGDNVDALKYYVYAKGQIKGAYVNPAEAITLSDKEQGVVISSRNQTVWERGGRFISNSVAGITEVRTGNGVSSIDACVYMLLKAEHVDVNIEDITGKDSTMLEMISEYIDETMNLTGCNLDEILYFVGAGKPVIAMKNNSEAVIITSYNSNSVTMYDPSTGQYQTQSYAVADATFAAAGNIYVSYMKGVK